MCVRMCTEKIQCDRGFVHAVDSNIAAVFTVADVVARIDECRVQRYYVFVCPHKQIAQQEHTLVTHSKTHTGIAEKYTLSIHGWKARHSRLCYTVG